MTIEIHGVQNAAKSTEIKNIIEGNDVVVFIKGTQKIPQCGFSSVVVQIFDRLGVPVKDVNILADPEMREELRHFSNWPTFPQIYVKGEFVGGCDIAREMFQNGELQQLLAEKGINVAA